MKQLKLNAAKVFKANPEDFDVYFAPGRINLIGEHIDYNGGCVLPVSLNMGTYGVCKKNNYELVRCYSENFKEDGIVEFEIDNFELSPKGSWVNFVKGIIKEFIADGNPLQYGFDIYVKGEIPNGAGLSSSASLELLLGVIIRDYYYLDYSNFELSQIGQRVEHNTIGVMCGLMDQFIIGNGKVDHCVKFNTKTFDYDYIPLKLNDYDIVVTNTNYRRTLQDSKYNERLSQCRSALSKLNKVKGLENVGNLCDLSLDDLNNNKDVLDSIEYNRAYHCISENQRVLDACKYLEENNIIEFANMLNASDRSLKEMYEVTGPYLDSLTESFRASGAIASRMTGAGFGGCIISICEKSKTKDIIAKAHERYKSETNLDAISYIASSSDYAKKVS